MNPHLRKLRYIVDKKFLASEYNIRFPEDFSETPQYKVDYWDVIDLLVKGAGYINFDGECYIPVLAGKTSKGGQYNRENRLGTFTILYRQFFCSMADDEPVRKHFYAVIIETTKRKS